MKAAELLTIDADAELRKLAEGTLEGPWQVPTELVRRAIAAGARRVDVRIARGRLEVRDDGRPLRAPTVEDLARLLDRTRPVGERHRAVISLESEPELLSVAAMHPSRVVVDSGAAGTTITLLGVRLDAEAARRMLRACVRFAPAAVFLDGTPVPRGFEATMVEASLPSPLAGRMAITADETARLWLLGAGVVSSHLTLPDTPGFEAVVELPRGAPSTLREAIEPHVDALVDAAVSLTLQAAASCGLDAERRRSLRARLLVAARRGLRRTEILRAAVFPMRAADGGFTWSCLSDLAGREAVPCLDPREDAEDFLLPPRPVLVIDAEERGRLAELLGLRFRPLERRQARLDTAARLRRAGRRLWSMASTAAARAAHPGAGRALPESTLTAEERAFLRAVRAALPAAAPAVWLCAGSGPPRRTRDGWALPRGHADVRRAVRRVAMEPAFAYLAVLALCEDAVPPPDVRERWRQMIMQDTRQ